jgi:hypothetical protein
MRYVLSLSLVPGAGQRVLSRFAAVLYLLFLASASTNAAEFFASYSGCLDSPLTPPPPAIAATIGPYHAYRSIVPQLILAESASGRAQAAKPDSVLFVRHPFSVLSGTNLLNPATERNTGIIVFLTNFEVAPGELSSSVTINLSDSNNQSYDIVAEDVWPLPRFQFTQVTFRLPNILSPMCVIRIKARGQISNAGTIRIRI